MKLVTQIDIAKQLNVTRITVSKALRDHPDISQGMKKKVRDTAEALGYIPNIIAQNLTLKKTNTIGVIVPDLENSFFAYATDSIIDTAHNRSYSAIISISRENKNFEKENIQKMIGMRVDGFLVCVTQNTNDPFIFQQIKKLQIPLVFFDREFPGLSFPSVTFDDKNGAVQALEKIIKAGYRKIAHIAGYSNVSIGNERSKGFLYALSKHGLEINPEWIIEGGFEINDGYNAFMKLYNSGNMPEIILAVNDRTALGVYRAANRLGLKIPDDIGIVAFGFEQIAQNFTPALSIINQNPRNVGVTAADMLIDIIENHEINRSKLVKFYEEFKWNDSLKLTN